RDLDIDSRTLLAYRAVAPQQRHRISHRWLFGRSDDSAACAPIRPIDREVFVNAKIIVPAPTGFEHQQLAVLFDRCQVLAGRFNELSSSAFLSEMNGLVVQLPTSLNRIERMAVTSVMINLLLRLVRGAGIDGRAEVAKAFLNLVDAGPTMEHWRLQW